MTKRLWKLEIPFVSNCFKCPGGHPLDPPDDDGEDDDEDDDDDGDHDEDDDDDDG